ncbi:MULTISPECIES: tripartite tricarboxylate transporter TctB family protein [unclassified Ensifer]|jgi:putative tricarboxylic transport membrane protein|uniref:tripartite tricarboxylate transporter TctB family protein n=1 Tax=Ensifer TaxID=106591 RepID=UPI00070B3CE0|nr:MULTISPECIES: tripartite tricarboxylate transporter TctB family protein [unclassified Ensifer]KQU74791.1 hypothetical protein ASD00_37740 [Ensifer sp. Root31]KQW41303.1 hypothetical protein ASD02_36115 [Ensifer sp. Root1252]KQW61414.1 hypothetical protein ASD03_36590 [Ensifer sp. Root127]KRC62241.1 hypothetical protein ASE32_36205 [Ensifer sp. Root231]KRC91140.1 hypothetical protein ASE47_36175 [Ensifer sp. Root258]
MRLASIVAACLVVVSIVAISSSLSLGVWKHGMPGPGLFPVAAAILLLVALAATMREGWRQEGMDERIEIPRFLGYGVAIIGFVGLLSIAGTLPAIFVFLSLVVAIVERLRWPQALAIASGTTFACWAVFERLLGVPLPAGFWS